MSKMSEVSAMVDAICEDRGYDSPTEFDFDDIDYLAGELDMSIEDVCAMLHIDSISI